MARCLRAGIVYKGFVLMRDTWWRMDLTDKVWDGQTALLARGEKLDIAALKEHYVVLGRKFSSEEKDLLCLNKQHII